MSVVLATTEVAQITHRHRCVSASRPRNVCAPRLTCAPNYTSFSASISSALPNLGGDRLLTLAGRSKLPYEPLEIGRNTLLLGSRCAPAPESPVRNPH